VGAGHSHPLYVHGHSRVHRLPPEVKVAATVAFVAGVALTPPRAAWAFGIDALALVLAVAAAGLRPGFVARRLLVIVPFVAFAFAIPFVASGEQVEVLGIAVSREGLWGAWNVLAKASLGATASILLAATTEVPRMLTGMTRLHVPAVLTAIASFMVRYLDVIAGELRRMRTAMAARGYAPRWLWQARPVATSAGALFVRSYERGERVHAAMLARGYTGAMPELDTRRATRPDWVTGAVLPLVSWAAAVVALAGVA
jgi:cobalt/nickel transport system permease protein